MENQGATARRLRDPDRCSWRKAVICCAAAAAAIRVSSVMARISAAV